MRFRFSYHCIIGRLGATVGWLIAFIVIVVVVASLVGGTVLHPVLYGIFIASVIVIPLCLFTSIGNAIIDALFGKRR